MRIAVTGHMDVSDDSVEAVRSAIAARLNSTDNVTGISCLARGADSIFAEAVLDRGGTLEVILPSPYYREKKVKPDHAVTFDTLISRAAVVHTLPHDEVGKEAYEEANAALIKTCDELLAVWDGQAGRKSGTATVVDAARSADVPVTVIWPEGARRGND